MHLLRLLSEFVSSRAPAARTVRFYIQSGCVLFLLALVAVAEEVPPDAADTAIVCPESFVPVLRPWLVHRASQGHRFALISNEQTPDDILAEIRAEAASGRLRYVLLVGDDEPAAYVDPRVRLRCVPAFRARARVNVRYGSEPVIATDSPYGDLNGDGSPELAVGRLPADSPAELKTIVDKILHYERESGFGLWRRQVNFVAGVGGFGFIADAVIEMSAKRLITGGVPSGYSTTMTYGSWRSPYCPDPRLFHSATMDRLNEGCLFWVYLGHGQSSYLDHVRVPGHRFHILDTRDAGRLDCQHGRPIAVMLSCYTAAFDRPEDCLAEEMLVSPGGPVAVVGGTRVTMPYAMAVLATEMLDECFVHHQQTLGDVVLAAKKKLLINDSDDPRRRLIDSIAGAISPGTHDLEAERSEHVLLFHLIGDPLLKLRHPQPIEVETDKYTVPGERLDVDLVSPVAGTCYVELVCRRDRTTSQPPMRPQFDASDNALAAFTDVYRQANDHRYTAQVLNIEPGACRAQLDVPEDASGPCHVRIFVEGPDGHALGAADVYVRRKKPKVEAMRSGAVKAAR